MKVWVSTLRRGILYHSIRGEGGKTVCGRFIGKGEDVVRGHLIGRVEAIDVYAAHHCPRCQGFR